MFGGLTNPSGTPKCVPIRKLDPCSVVTPDANREMLEAPQWMAEHFNSSGASTNNVPDGHGFGDVDPLNPVDEYPMHFGLKGVTGGLMANTGEDGTSDARGPASYRNVELVNNNPLGETAACKTQGNTGGQPASDNGPSTPATGPATPTEQPKPAVKKKKKKVKASSCKRKKGKAKKRCLRAKKTKKKRK